MSPVSRWLAASVALALPWGATGCVQPECSTEDFTTAECRVIAENEFARLRHPAGVEIRFQDPRSPDADSWDARGLLELLEDGRVRARVAGIGGFAISLRRDAEGPNTLSVVLDNVDPAATVTVGQFGDEVVVPPPDPAGLRRTYDVDLSAPGSVWIRGARTCPASFRLAVTADIQTNPGQFERIIERLAVDAEAAEVAGEPLVGLVIAGDLTESSRDDEFERIDRILRGSPVPVAVTAGNHDVYRMLRPHYNARFGPGNHTFEVCGTKVVLLDTGSGAIARSVEARLPELMDRAGAQHLIVGMHHPPYAGFTAAGWSMEDRAQHLLVEAALADTDLIVAGHSHALHHFDQIAVGDTHLDEIIVGTGGAYQGQGVPRYGYLRLTVSSRGVEPCFVEVTPPGLDDVTSDPLSDRLPYCGG